MKPFLVLSAFLLFLPWLARADSGLADTPCGLQLQQEPLCDFESLEDIDWGTIPFFFQYPEDVHVGFWNGEESSLASATQWGRPGHAIRGLKIVFADDRLALRVETHGAVKGDYEYSIRFNEGNWGPTTYYVAIDTQQERVKVSRSWPWVQLAELSSPQLRVETDAVSVLITEANLRLESVDSLHNWMVSVSLEREGEWFSYPGRAPYYGWQFMQGLRRVPMGQQLPEIVDAMSSLDAVSWLHGYYDDDETAGQRAATFLPVFVSLDSVSDSQEGYRLLVDGTTWLDLERISPVVLGTQLEVSELPRAVSLQLYLGDSPIGAAWQREVWNRAQAISIGIASQGQNSSVLHTAGFMFAVRPSDVWGGVIYDLPGFWQEGKTIDYICETFDRIAQIGGTDVVLTSFYGWEKVTPMPVISEVPTGGTVTITEADLREAAGTAHRAGLRLTVTYNHDVGLTWPPIDMSYLRERDKPAEWLDSFLAQVVAFYQSEATKCEYAGVDRMVVDISGYFRGNETRWAEGARLAIQAVKDRFSGEVALNVSSNDLLDLVTGIASVEPLGDADSFIINWDLSDNQWGWSDDSLTTLELRIRNQAVNVAALKSLVGAPVYATCNFLSFDGYVAHGWFDAFMGRREGRRPVDFIEQANAYEALLRFSCEFGVIDGLISFMYHWDDPFGPELHDDVLVYADLMGSIRNKPAEAVFARWAAAPAVHDSAHECEKRSMIQVADSMPHSQGPSVGHAAASGSTLTAEPYASWASYEEVWTAELGRSLHGIDVADGSVFALDWFDGQMYQIDQDRAPIQLGLRFPTCTTDFDIESDLIWTASPSQVTGRPLGIGALGRENLPLSLTANPSGLQIFGIEVTERNVFILLEPAREQRLIALERETGDVVFASALPEGISEAIGLELFDDRLFTFDWPSGIILELELEDDSVRVVGDFPVGRYVPASNVASGGFRGFHIEENGIYITTVGGQSGEASRIHFISTPDPG